MLKNKLAFLLAGLINNYNFIVIFSCAYSLSKLNPYINPSFIIFCEIIPGFITQLLYTKYLYQINYTYRWILLFIIQILSSLFLIIQYDKIPFLFTSIALVSIYTYLGESSMLSISSFYEQKEMKFWSIGTGLARVCGTGFYLIMDRWLDMRIIFGINLLIYLLGFSISLYLLDYRNKINTKKEEVEITSTELNTVPLEDFDLSQNEITKVPIPIWKKHIHFFLDIYCLAVAYFLSYFLGFAYIPLLVKSDFEYQICQFITGISIFLGRTIGNYIHIKNIKIYSLLHLYSFLSIIIFTISIIYRIQIPLLIINLMLIVTYLINGISYPVVYNYVYKNYTEEKSWYMGAVGQYTALFMIIGCVLGYPFQILFKKS